MGSLDNKGLKKNVEMKEGDQHINSSTGGKNKPLRYITDMSQGTVPTGKIEQKVQILDQILKRHGGLYGKETLYSENNVSDERIGKQNLLKDIYYQKMKEMQERQPGLTHFERQTEVLKEMNLIKDSKEEGYSMINDQIEVRMMTDATPQAVPIAFLDQEARNLLENARPENTVSQRNLKNKVHRIADNLWSNREQEGITDLVDRLSHLKRNGDNAHDSITWSRKRFAGAMFVATRIYSQYIDKGIVDISKAPQISNDQKNELNTIKKLVNTICENAESEATINVVRDERRHTSRDERNMALRRLGVYMHMLKQIDRGLYSFFRAADNSTNNQQRSLRQGMQMVREYTNNRPSPIRQILEAPVDAFRNLVFAVPLQAELPMFGTIYPIYRAIDNMW